MYNVIAEPTPNPQSMKFVVHQNSAPASLTQEPVAFVDSNESKGSPLAEKLFGFPWMAGVFIGENFVTITKQDWVDWDVLVEPLRALLEEHLNEGLPVLGAGPTASDSNTPDVADPTVRKIVEFIESEVRPAVAMDGGDILFHKYEDQIVYLRMKGSCSGCPSSTATLRIGIESRLKEFIPEIKEVVAV